MKVDGQGADEGVDGGDAVEVAVLVVKLREGYDRRQSVALNALSTAAILSLRRQVLDEAAGDNVPTLMGKITSLISTSTSLKMMGYYLRAMLVHRLKATSPSNCYKRLARDTLGIKSSADIAAYPALYELVQHHFPTLASAGVEEWLQNPIFSVDMTWSEWKRYLTKTGRIIIDAALRQFRTAVAPFEDWMQLGWVEIYDDEKLVGQGVRALRDIHLPKTKQAQRDVAASISAVAADLHGAGSQFVKVRDTTVPADPEYLIQLNMQHMFDARHHWIGKINHLPMSQCSLKVTQHGKLVQIKPIKAGDTLTWDYGVDYWVYQVTGMDMSMWLAEGGRECQRGRRALFDRMHESVMDYSVLLQKRWMGSLSCISSAVARESVLVELEEFLDVRQLVVNQ